MLSVVFVGSILNSAAVPGSSAQDRHSHVPPTTASEHRSTVGRNASSLPATVEFSITAAPAKLNLLPGQETGVFAYNGTVPGPVLELREGDRVVVHFKNDLPEATTIHWHGLRLPIDADGSPLHPVAPGEEYDYVFTIQPGTAGTYWYHPHPHHRTGYQIAMGLYGAIVVRSADDPLSDLITEKLIVLSDNRFHADGSIDLAPAHSQQAAVDQENGREGDILFVNGEVFPTWTIRSGEVQRWRVINASAARVYRLALPGHMFLHIANDGGLFERPVEVEEIALANSERVELLIHAIGLPGDSVVLQTLPYDRYIPQTRPRNWHEPRALLTLRYTDESPVSPATVPDRLRFVPELDTADASATQLVVLTQGLINGKSMDMHRVDVTASVGSTEIWEIENLVGMDHPFHLHGFQFQVIDRNGIPEPFRSWKDTVNVPKHETARIIVRYDDFPGLWMFHCHILDHEDHGMMGILQVR